ncbi:hypothetical protein ACHAWF_015010 [Thalassiosira exigua]
MNVNISAYNLIAAANLEAIDLDNSYRSASTMVPECSRPEPQLTQSLVLPTASPLMDAELARCLAQARRAAAQSSGYSSEPSYSARPSARSQLGLHGRSLPPRPASSLIDNKLARELALKRTAFKRSNSGVAATTTKFTYRNRSNPGSSMVKIASSSRSASPSPSSSAADLSEAAKQLRVEDVCPYAYLSAALADEGDSSEAERGLPTRPLHDDEFVPVTPARVAAYDADVASALRTNDLRTLRDLRASGRRLDGCNRFGESLLHVACRRSSAEVVSFLLVEAKVSPRIKDDYGRTPLHDACWRGRPAYDVVKALLEAEPRLAGVRDVRGHRPFEYARREHWGAWREFLGRNKDLLRSKK